MGALNVAGQDWSCNQLQGHGPVCGNPDAQAIWTTPQSGNRMEITVQAPSAEMARMWADRLTQHIQDLEHQLMLLSVPIEVWGAITRAIGDAVRDEVDYVSISDLDEVVDRLDALAHDMREAADR